MHADLLIKKTPGEELRDFVKVVSGLIQDISWKEHDSSFYVENRYFQASAWQCEIKAAIADDPEFSGFDFWIAFKADRSVPQAAVDGADRLAQGLTFLRRGVIRPLNMDRQGQGSIVYEIAEDGKTVKQVSV